MKKEIIFALSLLIIGCSEEKNELEQKKNELKVLKEQMSDIKSQIISLQKEIIIMDTSSTAGVAVEVMEVKTTTFNHFIQQPGVVSSKYNVVVSPEMSGVVVRLLAKEGSWVSKGQPICQLDASVLSNQVEELRQSANLAQTTFQRQKNLWEQKIGSEIQFLQAKNQYASLQKKLEAAEAQLDKLELSSPIDGRLDELFVNVGEFIAPGVPAFRVVNSKNLQVEVEIAEKYANKIKKGDLVKLSFNSLDMELEAPISFVGQVINPQNRTFKAKINIKNKNGTIKPNAVASLLIKDFTANDAIVLPSQIIKKDMRGNFLFTEAENLAKKTYIEVGLSHNNKTHVLSGLNLGQKVIHVGYNEVSDGSVVEVKN